MEAKGEIEAFSLKKTRILLREALVENKDKFVELENPVEFIGFIGGNRFLQKQKQSD